VFPALLSLEVWGGLVGMFEMNNLAMAVPSPVEDYFLLVCAYKIASLTWSLVSVWCCLSAFFARGCANLYPYERLLPAGACILQS